MSETTYPVYVVLGFTVPEYAQMALDSDIADLGYNGAVILDEETRRVIFEHNTRP